MSYTILEQLAELKKSLAAHHQELQVLERAQTPQAEWSRFLVERSIREIRRKISVLKLSRPAVSTLS